MAKRNIFLSTTANVASLFTNNLLDRVSSFLLFLMAGRYLGTFVFGQVTLALTLFNSFQIFAMMGARKMIVREVARDKTLTGQYLFNGSLVVITSSILTIIVQWIFIQIMGYSKDTGIVIIIFSLGLIPYSLTNVSEAIFQAWERMHYIVYASAPVTILKVVVAFILFSLNYGIDQVAVVWALSEFVIVFIEWLLIFKNIGRPELKFSGSFSWEMVRSSRTFFGIDGLGAIQGSIDTLILSKLASETEVGLYNAALQFSVPLVLIITNVGLSIYPVLCSEISAGFSEGKKIIEKSIEILLAIAFPASVGLFILATPALNFLYGKKFEAATGVLQVIAWIFILRAMTQVMGLTFLAYKKEQLSLKIGIITVLSQLIFGSLLVGQFGLIGIAWSTLIMWTINFLFHYYQNARNFFLISIGKVIWKPMLASAIMAVFLIPIKDDEFLLVVGSAALLYAFVLLVLSAWSAGGVNQLKSKYLSLWAR